MSTNDVPGANADNGDELAMGCWAEHTDGSMIFVASTENDEVVFSMFDMSKKPPIEFRDKMPIDDFKKHFSWDGKNVRWTWHDQTPFPWDKVIKAGIKDGPLPSVSARDQLEDARSVAETIAQKMGIPGHDVDPEKIDHLMDKESPRKIRDTLQQAIDECPAGPVKGKGNSKKVEKLLKKQAKIQKKLQELAG